MTKIVVNSTWWNEIKSGGNAIRMYLYTVSSYHFSIPCSLYFGGWWIGFNLLNDEYVPRMMWQCCWGYMQMQPRNQLAVAAAPTGPEEASLSPGIYHPCPISSLLWPVDIQSWSLGSPSPQPHNDPSIRTLVNPPGQDPGQNETIKSPLTSTSETAGKY